MMPSDIFPTGYQATELAGVQPGDSVVIHGAGLSRSERISPHQMAQLLVALVDHIARVGMPQPRATELRGEMP